MKVLTLPTSGHAFGSLIISLPCATGFLAVLLSVASSLAVTAQINAHSQSQNAVSNEFVYEVASIKIHKPEPIIGGVRRNSSSNQELPDGFAATNVTLRDLIRQAYGVDSNQISGAPTWISSEMYDVEARFGSSEADELKKLSPTQRRLARNSMLQALLADRFKLSIHREDKELPVYALVIAKNGHKLQESNASTGPGGGLGEGVERGGTRTLTGRGASIGLLASTLSRQVGRNVLDKTGLTGRYDFKLQFDADQRQSPAPSGTEADIASPRETSGPSIFTAIQEQLGLKLESAKGSVEIIVIDHVERPSSN